MIGPIFSNLVAGRKWIFTVAAAWAIALALIVKSTSTICEETGRLESQVESSGDHTRARLLSLQHENELLRDALNEIPDLAARADRLRSEAAHETKDAAIWAAQSKTLLTAIEIKRQELAELSQWSSDWHKARARADAQARLAEKAKEAPTNPNRGYAEMAQLLRELALARKRLIEVREEFTDLDKSGRENLLPRLQQAQADLRAAEEKLGKDSVLYHAFPVADTGQDPARVLFMRSLVPDLNGMEVSVYLDGTVNISKATEKN